MSINFESNNKSNLFFDSGTIKIGQNLKLQNVHCHTYCIGLLKLFGWVTDFSAANGKDVIHVNKASLIRQYREEYHPEQDISDSEIMRIIRSSCQEAHQGEYVKQNTETFKRIRNGPLAGMGIRGGVVDNQPPRAIKMIDDLVTYMKAALPSNKELHTAIKEQFQIVKLMNEDGSWIDPALAKIAHSLLPPEIQTYEKCEQLIDAMANAIKKNPYFLAAIDNLDDDQLENFRQKVVSGDKGKQMIQYLIPYSMALNALTAVFTKDVDLFDKIDNIWSQKQKPHNLRNYVGLFGLIKYYTLDRLSRLKKPIQAQSIAEDANRDYININIMEAVLADMYFGNNDNAKAGSALVRHPMGGKSDDLTGAGPTTIGRGKREYDAIELRPDLPKEWADLYAIWNFTFCSNFGTFPMLSMKLLIPTVSDYASSPEAYIYHRGMALYLYFVFNIFRGIGEKQPDFLDGWHSQEVTNALGQACLKSAEDYEKQVKNVKKISVIL